MSGFITQMLDSSATEWNVFSAKVSDHITNYVVPQYGDKNKDKAHKYSKSELQRQIEKYVARFGHNSRGIEEQKRDLLKIAHYCCILHTKMCDIPKVEQGRQDVQQLVDALTSVILAWANPQEDTE